MVVKLFRTELTATGRPVLMSGEVERGMLDKVDLVFHGPGGVDEQPSEEYKGGYVVLTSYRLIWLTSSAPAAGAAGVPCHLPLPAVAAAEHHPHMIKAARLKLAVRVDAASYPTPDPRAVASVTQLKMVCRGPSPETLHTQLLAALDRRAWAAAPPALLQMLHAAPGLAAAAGGAEPGRVGPRPPAERLAQPAAAAFQPNRAIVEGLCAIGYSRLHAVNAVVATRNAGVQEAVNWLCDNEGSPALDQPSPYVQQSGGSSLGGGGGSAALASGPSASSSGSPWAGLDTLGSAASSSSGYALYPPPPAPLAAGAAAAGAAAAVSSSGASFTNPLLQAQPESLAAGGWTFASAAPGGGSSGAGLHGSSSAAVLRAAPAGGVGVAGILKQEELKAARADATMEQAFSDLSALMAKAQEMVKLAEYFKERSAAKRQGSASDGEEELDAQTALDLLDLGIVSPVTRETAGSLYHKELARQLADFLRVPLERAGGMMPLPDVYCMYNRARGTELVSPDDLLQAVRLFSKIGAPLQLREFSSGVKVVQAASHSDEVILARIKDMAQPKPEAAAAASAGGAAGGAAAGSGEAGPEAGTAAAAAAAAESPAAVAAAAGQAGGEEAPPALLASLGPPVTRLEVALALGVSVAIAGEHLQMAEARGVLCRDEGPRGLVFYRNFFPDFSDASPTA